MRSLWVMAAVSLVCSTFSVAQQLVSGPVVVLLGAPGSGKSTQAVMAAKYLNVPLISVSELIRDNAAELQKARRSGITGMEPETDPLLNRFFDARLRKGDLSKGMILDGYPNTKDQADFASKLVAAGVIPKPVIVHLRIPDDIVRKRLSDKQGKVPASVEQRLKDYHRETTALQVYFPNADITEIDGTGKPKAVAKKVEEVLKAKFRK